MKFIAFVLIFGLFADDAFSGDTSSAEANPSQDKRKYLGFCDVDMDCQANQLCVFPGNSSGNAKIKKCIIACPPGWVAYGDSCYLKDLMLGTWYDAQAFCIGQGGFLVNIEDAEKNDFVRTFIGSDFALSTYWYHGLKREDGVWRLTATNTVATYFDFYHAPTSHSAYNCGFLSPDYWFKASCDLFDRGSPVCEMPAYPTSGNK